MEDSRRRSVMPGSRSGLPLPSSTFKKPVLPQSQLTSSLAMRAGRQSVGPMRGPPLAPSMGMPGQPQTNPRLSVYRPQPALMPTSAVKRTGAPFKDQRDTRNPQFKTATLQAVIQFLQTQDYPGDLSFKTLSSLSARDMQSIVKALVSVIDPNHIWGTGGAKFEDELLPYLRNIKYPYVDTLNKATLQTPGSMPNMPHILGVLHWLIGTCKKRELYTKSGDETLLEGENVPQQFSTDLQTRAIEWDYTRNAYMGFLNGQDNFTQEDQELEARFAARDKALIEDTQAMRNELEQLSAEYKRLTSGDPPIIAKRKVRDERSRDLSKLEALLERDLNKSARYQQEQDDRLARIGKEENEIQGIHDENAELEQKINAQTISADEAEQMTRERDGLTRSIEELKQKVEVTKRAYESLEVSWVNRGDQLEQAAEEYSDLLLRLNLDASTTDLTISVDLAREPLVRAEDIKEIIVPALRSIMNDARSARSAIADEHVLLEHELATLRTAIEQVEEDLARLEERVASVLTEADNVRETAQAETAASDAEAAKLDKEIGNARAAAKTYGIGVKSRLQTLQIKYQEQIGQTERIKEETMKSISKSAAEIATFKETVSGVLDDLFVAAESN